MIISICKECKSRDIEKCMLEEHCYCNSCKKFTRFIDDKVNTVLMVYNKTKELSLFVIKNCDLWNMHEQGNTITKASVLCLILRQQDFKETLKPYLDKHPKIVYKVIADNVSNEAKELISNVLIDYTTI